MSKIHCWQDIEALGGDDWLTPAERQLIAACAAGEECILGDATLPPEGPPDPERELRGELLRYLILGGCSKNPVRGWGVMVTGGHVTGALDLGFVRAKGLIRLIACRFDAPITAMQSRIDALNLSTSALPGLNAQGAEIKGNMFLREAEINGELSLPGTKITAQLDCDGAIFEPDTGQALNAQGMQVGGDLFFRRVTAKGEISLAGAAIAGQLSCAGTQFKPRNGRALNAQGLQVGNGLFLRDISAEGEVSLAGANITGQLACTGARFAPHDGVAFNAQRLIVSGGLIWRNIEIESGTVIFASAHVSDLADDTESWPEGGRLYLDGFTYDRISGSSTDAKRRIAWLEKGTYWLDEFLPQPFTHLANTLRATGHDSDASKVLFRREQLIRRHIRALSHVEPNGDISVAFRSLYKDLINTCRWIWDQMLRVVLGYGLYPFRGLIWLLGLIATAAILAQLTWNEGSFAPNSGPVLVSEGWKMDAEIRCVRGDPDFGTEACNPAARWSAQGAPGQDWETFQPLAYAADLVIPIVNFSQTNAWAPSTTRGPMGKVFWWARWFFTGAGWLITALAAAALAGVIRQE